MQDDSLTGDVGERKAPKWMK